MVERFSGLDGKKVAVKEFLDDGSLGEGTLSSRYLVTIDNENYFAKVFRQGENCFGRSSREMIRNEIAVLEYIHNNPQSIDEEDLLRYRGYGEIADVITVLFEDMITWRNGATMEKELNVKFEGIRTTEDVPTNNEILALKRSVEATKYQQYSVGDVVDIIHQIASQIGKYHNLAYNERRGVIHMDITPKNVILVNNGKGSKTKAIVIDFGIAREKDEPIDYLFNKASISDGKNGDYYLSQKGIFNLVYSPIYAREEPTAVPRLDTYNIVNLMCLMLTGRLVEHWEAKGEDNNTKSKSDVFDLLKKEILPRCASLDRSDIDKSKIASELTRMIVYGQNHNNPASSARYDSCTDLIRDLDALAVESTQREMIKIAPPTDIPSSFRDYKLPIPSGLEHLLTEWNKLSRRALSFQNTVEIPHLLPFQALETTIENTLKDRKITERFKKEQSSVEKLVTKRRALKAGLIGGLTAAAAAGVGYLIYFL